MNKLKKGLIPLVIFLMLFISILPMMSADSEFYHLGGWGSSQSGLYGAPGTWIDWNYSSTSFEGTLWNITIEEYAPDAVDDEMDNPTDWILYINNINFGHPVNMDFSGSALRMYWAGLDLYVTGDITFELLSNCDIGAGHYAHYASYGTTDIDGDGDTEFYYDGGLHNGIVDGTPQSNKDIRYLLYYTAGVEGVEFPGLERIGDISVENDVVTTGNKYVEWYYNNIVGGIVRHVDVLIAYDYVAIVGGSQNTLSLVVDGKSFYQPDSFLQGYGNSPYDYRARWLNVNKTIDNKRIIFELADILDNDLRVCSTITDIDLDGNIVHYRHDTHSNFGDGVVSFTDGDSYDWDIIYQFYMDGLEDEFNYTHDYANNVYFTPNKCKAHEKVIVGWDLNQTSILNTCMLNIISPSGSYDQSIQVYSESANWVLYPDEIGNWVVNLTVNDVNVSFDNLIVTGSINTWVKSYPNPSYPQETVTIYYNYSGTIWNGVITIHNSNGLLLSDMTAIFSPESSGSIDRVFTSSDTYTINIGAYFQNATYGVSYSIIHMCGYGRPNNIYVIPEIIRPNAITHIKGTHNHGGESIWVFIAGENYKHIGNSPVFDIIFSSSNVESKYNISLVRIDGSGEKTVLDWCILTVSGEVIADVDDTIWGLPTEYVRAMFGAFITLGFLIIPFALSMSSKHETSKIVYAIFGGIGLGVATLAGLFPLWLPLMISIMIVAVMIIEYKKGK